MAADNSSFISIENVSMRFGDVEAVRDVTLSVDEGTIFGLVGSDGAGKSTLLRMVATMIRPVSGNILIGTLDVVKDKQESETFDRLYAAALRPLPGSDS